MRSLVDRKKVEQWAAANAYTLIFLSFMFFVTWAIVTIIGLS